MLCIPDAILSYDFFLTPGMSGLDNWCQCNVIHVNITRMTVLYHLILYCYVYSMLQLDHDLDQLSLTEKSDDSSSSASPTEPHSAPVTPAHRQEGPPITVGYRRSAQGGFLEGLLGCLRPVWTIIGKATTAELKQQGKVF